MKNSFVKQKKKKKRKKMKSHAKKKSCMCLANIALLNLCTVQRQAKKFA